MAAKRKKPVTERRRTPFDYADTDWGREQDRKHRANQKEIKAVRGEVKALRTDVQENTRITQGMAVTFEELKPVLTAVRGGKKVGRFAWGAGLVASKAAKFWWGLIGLGAAGYALLHGDGWRGAVEAFGKAFK